MQLLERGCKAGASSEHSTANNSCGFFSCLHRLEAPRVDAILDHFSVFRDNFSFFAPFLTFLFDANSYVL